MSRPTRTFLVVRAIARVLVLVVLAAMLPAVLLLGGWLASL